jgi:hypothetical protein
MRLDWSHIIKSLLSSQQKSANDLQVTSNGTYLKVSGSELRFPGIEHLSAREIAGVARNNG